MPGPRVQIEAAKTDRSLVGKATPVRRPALQADPVLKFWRWMINSAVHEAKKTEHGFPTYNALLQRRWIEEFQPAQADKAEWERSFECGCQWLSLDVTAERKRLLEEIDAAWHAAWMAVYTAEIYQRRALAYTCAGMPRVLGKQYALPLMSQREFEMVADVEYPEPARVAVQLETRERRKAA